MGCPGGTRSVFTRGFRAKRELNVYFTTHGKLYSRRRTVRFIANFLSCWACSTSRVTCRRTIFSYLASHGSCTDPYKQKLSIMKELWHGCLVPFVKTWDQFRFLGNCPPTPPWANINTYYSFRANCWLRGVSHVFPRIPSSLPYALCKLTLTLLVKEKITASCLTNILPEHYINRYKQQNQLWKTVMLTSFLKTHTFIPC